MHAGGLHEALEGVVVGVAEVGRALVDEVGHRKPKHELVRELAKLGEEAERQDDEERTRHAERREHLRHHRQGALMSNIVSRYAEVMRMYHLTKLQISAELEA